MPCWTHCPTALACKDSIRRPVRRCRFKVVTPIDLNQLQNTGNRGPSFFWGLPPNFAASRLRMLRCWTNHSESPETPHSKTEHSHSMRSPFRITLWPTTTHTQHGRLHYVFLVLSMAMLVAVWLTRRELGAWLGHRELSVLNMVLAIAAVLLSAAWCSAL